MEYVPARRKKRRPWLLLAAAVLLLGFFCTAQAVRSTVQSAVVYRGRIALTQILQESVLSCLPENDSFESFVKVRTDGQSRVTAVETNSVALSRLQAELTHEVNDRLQNREPCFVRLPAGTFTGSYFLTGRGPLVSFRVIPASGVDTELRHRFESAGVNQTRHSIVLELSVDGLALLPGTRSPFEVRTQIVLAETVIVGVTPDVYANFAAGRIS